MGASSTERVDLGEMGIWGKLVRVEFGGRHEEVWVQTLGDRTEAMERGHEAMQRKLLEFRPGSERAEALLEALMLAPASAVAELALAAERGQTEARLRREISDPVRPRQDRAAGEKDADFARRMEEHRVRCQELSELRAERLAEAVEGRRAELLAMDRRQLAELARPRRIDIECWNAFARTCDDWVLLRALRRGDDHAHPYFETVEQVKALHPAVKEHLRQAYRELESSQGESLPKG